MDKQNCSICGRHWSKTTLVNGVCKSCASKIVESAPSASDNTESFQLLCDLFLEVISACENKFVIDTKSYKRKINELRSATKNIS